jgi:hypothetical protein
MKLRLYPGKGEKARILALALEDSAIEFVSETTPWGTTRWRIEGETPSIKSRVREAASGVGFAVCFAHGEVWKKFGRGPGDADVCGCPVCEKRRQGSMMGMGGW